MKKKISNILLILALLVGLSLLIYPSFSDYWNSFHQSRTVASYVEQMADMTEAEYETILERAHAYNNRLKETGTRFAMTPEEMADYQSQLDPVKSGVMGYIEIPQINCKLPIYHGTEESVLQIGVGHLEWSSLPVGGVGSHTVLSGHRGLPSAKLFTNLDQLRTGDSFLLYILNETLTYEVDQILIVDPTNTEYLRVESGQDYCTLMTCTPYGVNSHRLLVRGHRIDTVEAAGQLRVPSDATQIEPLLIAPMLGIPVLVILLIGMMVKSSKRRRRRKMDKAAVNSDSVTAEGDV